MLYWVRHFVTSSLRHFVTSSLRHFVTSSLRHFVTSSLRHFVTSSLRHFVTSSLRHFVTSSLRISFTVKAPWVRNPPRGFSLMEVLVVGALGSFILAGTLKTLSISVESAQIVRVSLANEALARAVGGVLNSPEECKENLKPGTGRLTGSDSGNGKGDLTQLTKGDDVVLSTSTQNGANIFKYSFDIIKMQLSGEGTLQKDSTDGDDAKKRTFTVYYKKRGVGSLSTLGDLECSADSQLGCYFYQCDLSYELDSSNEVSVCRSLTCVSGGGGVGAEIAGQMCELGEYLVGFTAGGAKICVDMSCDCEDMGSHEATCRSNSWQLGLRGVKRDSEGNMIPDCVQLPKVGEQRRACADGEFVEGYNANGEIICKEYTCSGGMVKDEMDEKKCKCPDAKPYWDGSKCVESAIHSCPATAPYSYNSRCVSSCPQALPVVGRNKVCQSCTQVNPTTPYWNKRLKKCVSVCRYQGIIPRGGYYMDVNNNDCVLSDSCGAGETGKPSSGCVTSCPPGSNGSCATCPPGAATIQVRVRTGSNSISIRNHCKICPKYKPYPSGSTCVHSCSSTQALDPVKKICVEKHWGCPPDRPKVGTNGQCEACPAGTYWKFVPTTQDFGGSLSREEDYYKENYDDHYSCSSTCPSNQHKYDGRCVSGCPDDKPKVGANNVCEACPTGHHWNRITKTCNNCSSPTPYWNTLSEKCVSTCPSGTTLNSTRKACVGNSCPIDKPYRSNYNCASSCGRNWRYVYNNTCVSSCPAGSVAIRGQAGGYFAYICVPNEECPDTTPYYSGSSCVSTCPSDKRYKYNNTCVSTCPTDKPKVGANNVCEACPPTTPKISGNTCVTSCPTDKRYTLDNKCVSSCPDGKPHIGANNVCVACPPATPKISGNTCVASCPTNKRYTLDNKCVSSCPDDKPHIGANNVCEVCSGTTPYRSGRPNYGQSFRCVSSCSAQEHLNRATNICSVYDQDCELIYNGQCVSSCPFSHPYTTELSSFTGTITCVNSCPSGTTLNVEKRTCFSTCPSYWKYRLNYNNRACVTSCPTGTVVGLNNQCVEGCPLATPYFDVPTGNCVSTCPDSRPKKANATCVESCPAERPKTGSNNVCEACSGTTPYWNGSACVSACPSDKPHIDPTLNFHCISTCPADRPNKIQIKKGGIFGCINDCSGDLIRGANNECVCPADKPYRYTGVIGLCVATCTGFTRADDSDGKWCVPNT